MPVIKMIGTMSGEITPETKSVSYKGKEYLVEDVLLVMHGKVTDLYEIIEKKPKKKLKKKAE